MGLSLLGCTLAPASWFDLFNQIGARKLYGKSRAWLRTCKLLGFLHFSIVVIRSIPAQILFAAARISVTNSTLGW
jgi:hypothetical protein